MYRTGHYGISLFLHAPVEFILISFGYGKLAIIGAAIILLTTTPPDIDRRIPRLPHRSITHTIWFAAFVGGILGLGFAQLSASLPMKNPLPLLWIGFLLGVFSVGAHLVADALTPMGVRPFSPICMRRYSFRLWQASSQLGNGLFTCLGGNGRIRGLLCWDTTAYTYSPNGILSVD